MKNLFKWVFILVPVFFVFNRLFLPGLLWGGDAPYFYSEAQKQLFSQINVFTERGIPFGGFNSFLWLYPLMFVFGAFGKLGVGSDLALRIIFLFPSLILSLLGPYLLAKYLKFGSVTRFFSVFVYLLNTYFILLVDGGQVGVALAYGIFPFTILYLLRIHDDETKKSFLLALLSSVLLTLADPRIFAIALITVIIYGLLEKKLSRRIFYLLPFILLANAYWLIPLIKIGAIDGPSEVNNLNLLSLINPLFLFSPHWPQNIFGKIVYPPFYFALIPLLVFASLIIKKKKQVVNIALLFLILAFFAKGGNFPLGFIYDFVVNNIPFGSAFRDSSKFFIPLTLFGGILIGETITTLQSRSKIFLYIAYFYLLFLVGPALVGKMNFLLSNHKVDQSYKLVSQELIADPSEFRTLWFTSKHPLSYETNEIPAIDARDLAGFRPFAAINASEDVFNFLNDRNYVNWFKVLGIKYLFLVGDARNINPNESEIKLWNEITKLVSLTPGLEKKNWGTTFEVFEVPDVLPKSFNVDSLIAVVGKDLQVTEPAVYFEDGKWDPRVLGDKDSGSVKIFFNGAEKNDLVMSFLQKYFVGANNATKNDWAFYREDQYLKYKYELLIRGYNFSDFDYGRGIAFSTGKDENIKFELKIPNDGKYILAVRKGNLENQKLHWEIIEKDLEKGSFEYVVSNSSTLEVFNVMAVIPLENYSQAEIVAEDFVGRFGMASSRDVKDVEVSPGGFWRIVTTAYNSNSDSLPVYSMVNGEYLK